MREITKIKNELTSELKKIRKEEGLREYGGNKEPEKIYVKSNHTFDEVHIKSDYHFFFQLEIEAIMRVCEKNEKSFCFNNNVIIVCMDTIKINKKSK